MIGDNGICRAHTRLFSISCSNVKPKTERHLVYLFFAVASPEFCSRGDGRVAHGFRSSWWQSHPEVKAIWRVRSAKTNMTKVFFATACHSNSNQCFNMRDRPISTNNKRLQNFACIKLQRGGGHVTQCPVPGDATASSMLGMTIRIRDEGGWRRRRDLDLRRCGRVAAELKFSTDWSGETAEFTSWIIVHAERELNATLLLPALVPSSST